MELSLTITSYQVQAMGADAQKSFDQGGGTFGRGFDNDWILPDPERIVSSHHGLIYFQDETFFVTDTSTNGIFIDGSAQALGKDNSAELRDGSTINLGDYELAVSLVSSAGQEDNSLDLSPKAVDDINDQAEAISSPGYDPLQHMDPATPAPMDPIAQQNHTPEQSTPAAQSDHSPAINDFFESPKLNIDEELEVAEELDPSMDSGQAASGMELIPEDWELPGASEAEPDPIAPSTPSAQTPLEPSPARQSPVGSAQIEPALPTPQPTPKRAPEPEPQSGIRGDLFEIFMQAAGLEASSFSEMNREQAMEDFGSLFRCVVQGLMELEHSRSSVKNEFRMLLTIIRPAENNPLKFSPNVDAALQTLFSNKGSGFLDPCDAINQSIDDIRNHQIGMITGMQAAFSELLQRLQPSQFSGEQGSDSGVNVGLMSKTKNSRAWENYCQFYKDTVLNSGNTFQALFGEAFSRAYEEQVQRLSTPQGKP